MLGFIYNDASAACVLLTDHRRYFQNPIREQSERALDLFMRLRRRSGDRPMFVTASSVSLLKWFMHRTAGFDFGSAIVAAEICLGHGACGCWLLRHPRGSGQPLARSSLGTRACRRLAHDVSNVAGGFLGVRHGFLTPLFAETLFLRLPSPHAPPEELQDSELFFMDSLLLMGFSVSAQHQTAATNTKTTANQTMFKLLVLISTF